MCVQTQTTIIKWSHYYRHYTDNIQQERIPPKSRFRKEEEKFT